MAFKPVSGWSFFLLSSLALNSEVLVNQNIIQKKPM